MNKIKQSFIDEFDNILILQDDSKKIYDNIIIKKHNNNYVFKLAVIFFVIISIIGVANAKTIKERFEDSWIKHIFVKNDAGNQEEKIIYQSGDNYVVINENVDYEEMNESIFKENCSRNIMVLDRFYDIEIYEDPCFQFGSFEEIEEKLNVKFIRSSAFKKDKLVIKELSKQNGNISYMLLEMTNINGFTPDNYVPNKVWTTNKSFITIDVGISLYTQYYDLSTINDNRSGYSTNVATDYYIKDLDVHAYIVDRNKYRTYNTVRYNPNIIDYIVTFKKNGITYGFVIKGFKPDKDSLEIVKEFLDTLYLEDNN